MRSDFKHFLRKKNIVSTVAACVIGATLVACGGGGGGGPAPAPIVDPTPTPSEYTSGRPDAATVPVTSAAAISAAVGIEGAARVAGDIPAPGAVARSRANYSAKLMIRSAKAAAKMASTGPNPRIAATPAPTPDAWLDEISSTVGQISFSDNSTFNFAFSSSNVPTAVFVQFDGSDDYFIVPLSALQRSGNNYNLQFYGPTSSGTQIITTSLSSQITIQVFYGDATPTDLADGVFTGSDVEANWSAPAYVDCVTTPALTGALQFNLTWNTENDVDLHVIEPNSNEIYYNNPVSDTGGELDVDNTWAYGPENIYWESNVPAGTYQVFVVNYDGDAAPSYTLTVTKQGVSQTYTGTLPATYGAESAPITVTMP